MLKSVKVKVPGTSANCGPGFDSIGIACTIYNELELTLNNSGKLIIEIDGEGKNNIPCDERNVVWKSIQYLLRKAEKKYDGGIIKMSNGIPLARGLGSSAAAIVAGLMAANLAIGTPFNKQEVFQMATDIEGHPDNVAPAIFGGITLSIDQDHIAQCLSFMPQKELKLVVAIPSFNLSTKMARRVLPNTVPLQDAVFNVSRTALLVGALCKGEYQHLRNALGDKLHQPYRLGLIPGMEDVFNEALENGALGVALSGAGPCLIAFTNRKMNEIGEAMVNAFKSNGVNAKYVVLDIDSQGVQAKEF